MNLKEQQFVITVVDGSPGNQIIKSLFGLNGKTLNNLSMNSANGSFPSSLVLVPGIMHVGMMINRIVLNYMDMLFPWMFQIFGINNIYFKNQYYNQPSSVNHFLLQSASSSR